MLGAAIVSASVTNDGSVNNVISGAKNTLPSVISVGVSVTAPGCTVGTKNVSSLPIRFGLTAKLV